MARKIYVNVDESRLVGGINSSLPPILDNMVEADNVDYELYFLTSSGGETLYEPIDYSSASVKFAVGPNPPSGATLYAATTAWTNLSSTVTATLVRTITGTASVNEQQRLTFAPDAFDGTFSLTYPSQALTFTSVTGGIFTTSGNHGLAVSQGFTVTGFGTPSGFSNGNTLFVAQILASNQFVANSFVTSTAITSYSATTAGTGYTITAATVALDARSTTSEVETALQQIAGVGFGNVDVTGIAGRDYRFSFKNSKGQAALPLMTVAYALTAVYGKYARVNFNTVSLVNAISASATLDATLEIEVTNGSEIVTVLQVPVTIRKEVIASGSPTPITGTSSFGLLDGNGATWLITIDSSGVLTATKQ
jgi:hypothetical protein